MLLQSALLLAVAPLFVVARTDLSGCTQTTNGPVVTWYVPGTGELCDFLDCGGGRAPPKTTVPGCAAYSGTASYSPSYLPGWGPNGRSVVASSTTIQASSSAVAVTGSASGSAAGITSGAVGASASASGSARTTPLASLSSRLGNGTASTSGVLAQSTNAGNAVGGSFAAVGGMLIGAIAML